MQYFFLPNLAVNGSAFEVQSIAGRFRHATFLKEVTEMQLGVVTTSTWEMKKADSLYSSIFPGCKTTTYAI